LKIRFWGTRGSLPHATSHDEMLNHLRKLIATARGMGIDTLRTFESRLNEGKILNPISYGGNTSCTEFSIGDQFFLVDMGSGLREAGTYYLPKGIKTFHIFLTHMHWDHIMGLPFFIPVHTRGCRTIIHHVHRNAPEYVKINFNGVNFPLSFDQLLGSVEFEQLKLYQTKSFGDMKVTPFVLDHPGGCFGYRFDANGKSASLGVDGEYKRITPEALGQDLPYYQKLDLLIFDAQYEMSELINRFDWGHSSPPIGVELALREGIKKLALSHHDPWATHDKISRMLLEARAYSTKNLKSHLGLWESLGQATGPEIISAYDGLQLSF
jgi:phosphoribosyl 1,2-cyclic phosphodiesterase